MPKARSAARVLVVLIEKKLTECTLIILVSYLFLDRPRTIQTPVLYMSSWYRRFNVKLWLGDL